MNLFKSSFICATMFFLGACSQTVYLDQIAGPGNPVPPPDQNSQPIVNEFASVSHQVLPVRHPPVNQLQRAADGTLNSQQNLQLTGQATPIDSSCFQKLYSRANKPRIAIFLNRRLSDEVRQWKTDERLITSGEGALGVAPNGAYGPVVAGSGNQSMYTQRYLDDVQQQSLSEKDLWAFEDGFSKPFLRKGAKLVDRATIMRLAAHSEQGGGNGYAPMSPKQIEMESLKKYADVYTELLVEKDSLAETGYTFKATAKGVESGLVLANVTTLDWNWDALRQSREELVATAAGYQFETVKNEIDINNVANRLAIEMMNELCYQWQ